MLALLFPAAMVPFATVHPLARGIVSLLAGLLGGLALLWGVRHRRPSGHLFGVALLGAVALALSALPLLPVSAAMRLRLQPGFGALVNDALAMAGVSHAALALDPYAAMQEWAVSAYFLIFLVGVGLAVRSSERATSLAWVVTGSGIALVAVATLHRVTGARSIWWVSAVPEFSRDPFFAPFVNPNDGGLACAAGLLFALGLMLRHGGGLRWVALGCAGVMAVGMRLSGSRGAILGAAAGLFVFVLVVGDRRLRMALAGLAAVGLLGVLLIGPREISLALSEWLVPEALGPGEDVYTGRGDISRDALAVIAGAPLLGVGHAGFDDGFHVVKSTPTFTTTTHAHQELLQIAAEHGLPVLLLWLVAAGLVAAVVVRAASGEDLSRRRRGVLAGAAGAAVCIGVACLYSFPLRIGAVEILFALAIGTCLGLGSGEERARLAGSGRALRAIGATLFLLALSLQLAVVARADGKDANFGSADLALARGDRAMERGDATAAAQAAGAYRAALARQPLRRDAAQKLSRALFAMDDFDGATAALELATRVYPTLAWPWRDLARLQRRLGDYEASRNTWRQMLACDLPEGDERRYVEEAMRGPGDPARIATLVLPERADRLVAGARVLEAEEALAAAESAYRRAAAMEPRYRAHLGAALLRWERPAEALAAVADGPESCFVVRVRAEAQLRAGDATASLESWQRALLLCGEEEETFREIRLGTAKARIALNDERGLTGLEAILRENPDDIAARRLLIGALRRFGMTGRLAEELDSLVRTGRATPAERAELDALGSRQR